MSNDQASLLQVEAKLERALSHHASLESDIARWELEHRDEVEARALINGTNYEYRVVKIPTMPALRWGTVIGDILHNLRSALDYLAWHAATASCDTDVAKPARVVFPIATTAEKYEKSPAVRQFSTAYQEFFSQFQPFNQWAGPDRWVGPYEHPLSMLQRLSNAEKHRLITPLLGRQGAIKVPAAMPIGAVAAGATNHPINRGSLIFRIRRELVSADPPPSVRVSPFVALTSLEGAGHALGRLLVATEFVRNEAVSTSLFTNKA